LENYLERNRRLPLCGERATVSEKLVFKVFKAGKITGQTKHIKQDLKEIV
jgi:hypothetical protein